MYHAFDFFPVDLIVFIVNLAILAGYEFYRVSVLAVEHGVGFGQAYDLSCHRIIFLPGRLCPVNRPGAKEDVTLGLLWFFLLGGVIQAVDPITQVVNILRRLPLVRGLVQLETVNLFLVGANR